MQQKELSVVYLMWVPLGIDYLKAFIKSYRLYDSGVDHDLVVIFNGYGNLENLTDYHEYLSQSGISYSFVLLEQGQDILAYRIAASKLSTEYVLFFNTYCQILSQNWGTKYLTAIRKSDVGMVGATGSWQSKSSYGFDRAKWLFSKKEVISRNIPYYGKKKVNFGSFSVTVQPRLALLGALINSAGNLPYFPLFPNYHLRTNSFIIKRIDWLHMKVNPLKTKRHAYLMESGHDSFTNQMLRTGRNVMVMDKNGDLFPPDQWRISKTFCFAKQENLIVSDNFTKQYADQDQVTQLALSKSIWRVV